MLATWARNSVGRIKRDGLQGAVQSARYPYIRLLQQLGDVHGTGENVFSEEWDVLIVLDACRYDLLREVADEYEFTDRIESKWSLGSVTKEWMTETFVSEYAEQMRRTAYVCGNPHSDTLLDESEFYLLDETWRNAWDNTIPPRALTDRAIEVWRNDGPERMIVHYMQPHCPFIPWGEKAQAKSAEEFGNQRSKDVWQRLERNELTSEEVWKGYRANLNVVLEEVSLLLENVKADDVVVTSDHGNALGEWGVYGHKPHLPLSCLREVPWIRTSAEDTGTHIPDFDFEKELNISRTEQLNALGYVE